MIIHHCEGNLKLCPFCGYGANVERVKDLNWVNNKNSMLEEIYYYYRCVCSNCRSKTVNAGNMEKAIELWNRRVSDG